MAKKKTKKQPKPTLIQQAKAVVFGFGTAAVFGLTLLHLPATTAPKAEPPIVEAPEPEITPELARQALVTYEEPKQEAAETPADAEPVLTQEQADAVQVAEYQQFAASRLAIQIKRNEAIKAAYEARDAGVIGNIKSAIGMEP